MALEAHQPLHAAALRFLPSSHNLADRNHFTVLLDVQVRYIARTISGVRDGNRFMHRNKCRFTASIGCFGNMSRPCQLADGISSQELTGNMISGFEMVNWPASSGRSFCASLYVVAGP